MPTDPVQLCIDMISVNTTDSMNGKEIGRMVSGYVSEIADFQMEEHERNGVRNFLFYSNSWDRSSGILFNGHYDVVPANGWEDAFSPRLEDGKIYGRGSGDMKAGLAAIVDAFSKLAAKNLPVALMVVGDEEKGGSNGTEFVLEKTGISAERVFVAEFTSERAFGDTIKNGRRGVFQFSLEVEGKGGHASRPYEALNPAHAIREALNFLVSYRFKNRDGMVETTVSPTSILMKSGAVNAIPSSAKMVFDMRYNVSTNPGRFVGSLVSMLSEMGYKAVADVIMEALPFYNPSREFEEEITRVMKSIGYGPKFSTAGGSSDARFFSERGMPVLELGTRCRNAHAKDEHTFASDIPKLSDALVKYGIEFFASNNGK